MWKTPMWDMSGGSDNPAPKGQKQCYGGQFDAKFLFGIQPANLVLTGPTALRQPAYEVAGPVEMAEWPRKPNAMPAPTAESFNPADKAQPLQAFRGSKLAKAAAVGLGLFALTR